MMKTFRKAMSCLAILAASLTAWVPAWGQEFIIEEIIVTASKRAQTLQEIPIAVTVVTADTMEKAQINDIQDLQSLVPSLKVTQLQTSGNTNFIIRGFGNGANNAGIEPSVGVFIDGVYRSRSASALADLPNLERIEVLRGPQSTLFGKNASAGVISVITAAPDLNGYSGSASVTVGDYNEFIVKGDITGPLSDTVAFSLSGNSNTRDGYYTNLSDGAKLNEHNRWGVRGQLLFRPSDNLEFRLIADTEEIDEVCCGVSNLVNGPTGGIIAFIGGEINPEDPFSRSQYYDFNPTNEIENSGVSLQIDYDWESVTLTSITSSRTMDRFENADVDFTSARLISSNSGDTEISTFTQELRLTSTGDGSVNWMVGGYFFDEEIDIANTLYYGDDFRAYGDALTNVLSGNAINLFPSPLDGLEFALGMPPGTFFASGQGRTEFGGAENQAFSIFGQVDFDLGDRTTLTVGANYTEDEKDTFYNETNTDVFSAVSMVAVGFGGAFAQITGLPPTPANIAANQGAAAIAAAISTTDCTPATAPNCNAALALQPLQFMPPFLAYPNAVEPGSSNDDQVTWSVRLAFDATDSLNIYGGVSTGFKATSWNLSRDSRPFEADIPAIIAAGLVLPNLNSGTRFAGPEDAIVYEIGLKARFNRSTVNFAIFDQEIEDFQDNLFLGTGFNLANAGIRSTTGAELEWNWSATDALQLAFAATWLDSKYDEFTNAEGPDGPTDLSGTKVPGVPELSINTSAIYNFELGASTSGFVRVEYIYEDEVQINANVPPEVASREISTFNASLGLEWDNGFQVMLYGRNINDDDYLLSSFPSVAQGGSVSGYPNVPRTYGLTLTMNFN